MPESSLPKWTINSSEYPVKDRWLTVRLDSATTPDGHTIDSYYVLEYSDWVNCLVVDDQDDVILVHQYRHGAGEYVTEVIGGGVEPDDASFEESIRRELEEESGYTGGDIYHIGSSYPNPANHTNKVHSFLAVGGSCSIDQRLEKGETLNRVKMPFGEFIKMMHEQNGDTVYPALHLATLFLAENFINRSNETKLQELKKYL